MGKRGPSAQYAYGITIEAGNYNEVINGFEKRLKDLDKVTANTTKTFAALSEAMKSGKQVDFSKAEGQLTGLVAEMEEVSKWREQLAGGQKLSDMFDGFDQVKQQLGQVTGQLDKFGANVEEIFSILQNVPQNTSKTFVDIRKVLQRQASDMNKIIAELNNPTEKTDVSGLKNQLSGLATDFVNEWNKAASQGIKMDQVVDFKPFATVIKSAISGARSLGAEFNDVSASVTEATKNVVALYSVKHPTGMFKDIAAGMSGIEAQSKRAEQTANRISTSFKAAINIVEKLKNSDMGLAQKSREMDEFLAKLKNPEITIDLKNKDITREFINLESNLGKIIGDTVNITPDFLKNLPIDSLKELGSILQNIVAMWNEYDDIISEDLGGKAVKKDIEDYSVVLKNVIAEIKEQLNEVRGLGDSVKENLSSILEGLNLKDIKITLSVPGEGELDEYTNALNNFIDKLAGNIESLKLPLTIVSPTISNSKDEKGAIADAKAKIKNEIDSVNKALMENPKDEDNIINKAATNIANSMIDNSGQFKLYLEFIKQQFEKIRNTISVQKKNIEQNLQLDFKWSKENFSGSFDSLFNDIQQYFVDNPIKVEIDDTYLKDRIVDTFKQAGGVDVQYTGGTTPIDSAQLASAMAAALKGILTGGEVPVGSFDKNGKNSSIKTIKTDAIDVVPTDYSPKFVFNIQDFMAKHSGELSNSLSDTLSLIINAVRDISKQALGKRTGKEAKAALQSIFNSNGLDILEANKMTDDDLIKWVQEHLLKADASGTASGRDIVDTLGTSNVKGWGSVKKLASSINQLFIKIEEEQKTAQDAITNVQSIEVLKDIGNRARAIQSKSKVQRSLNGGEINSDLIIEQLGTLQKVRDYKLKNKNDKYLPQLDDIKDVYEELLDIQSGSIHFEDEAGKQKQIEELRERLYKIRMNEDAEYISAFSGRIEKTKTQKNGSKVSLKPETFSGGNRENGQVGLVKALDRFEAAQKDGYQIKVILESTSNDKTTGEWITTEDANGTTIYSRRRRKDAVINKSKSDLTRQKERTTSIENREINFKPFKIGSSYTGVTTQGLESYNTSLQDKLNENQRLIEEQETIVADAKKKLEEEKKNLASYGGVYGEFIDMSFVAQISEAMKEKAKATNENKLVSHGKEYNDLENWEKRKVAENSKKIKESDALIDTFINGDSGYKSLITQFTDKLNGAFSELDSLLSGDDTLENRKRIQSVLEFINNIKGQFNEFLSVMKTIDEGFDLKFENLSPHNLLSDYKQKRDVIQAEIDKIDKELASVKNKKNSTIIYNDVDKTLAEYQMKASQYYRTARQSRRYTDLAKLNRGKQDGSRYENLSKKWQQKGVEESKELVTSLKTFIDELTNKFNESNSKTEKSSLSVSIKEAERLLEQLRSVMSGKDMPLVSGISKDRYNDIINAENTYAELTKQENELIQAREDAVARMSKLSETERGAIALERASRAGKTNSESARNITRLEGMISSGEKKKEELEVDRASLEIEASKLESKKEYVSLLEQEKKSKEKIVSLERQGLSTEKESKKLKSIQTKIKKVQDKLDIQSSSDVAEKAETDVQRQWALQQAVIYDEQEKLVRSQLNILESKKKQKTSAIENIGLRGLNSAAGSVELNKFIQSLVSEFKSSQYFLDLQNGIRDKYLKDIYKEDGTVQQESVLSSEVSNLISEYKSEIYKTLIDSTGATEKEIDKFLSSLRKDTAQYTDDSQIEKLTNPMQKQLAYAFKQSNIGEQFLGDYKALQNLMWDQIHTEEKDVIQAYKDSINVDKHTGTIKYTSYATGEGIEISEDLKAKIIAKIQSEINEIIEKNIIKKTALLGEITESKKKAMNYGGITNSDIRNADVSRQLSGIQNKIVANDSSTKKVNAEIAAQENINYTKREEILKGIKEVEEDITKNKEVQERVQRVINDLSAGTDAENNEATSKDLEKQRKRLESLQKKEATLISKKSGLHNDLSNVESLIFSSELSKEDDKILEKLKARKKTLEAERIELEREAEAWRFVEQARTENLELSRKSDQQKEEEITTRIETIEGRIAEKKEKQVQIQAELNSLRGQEVKDIDAIDRKEEELAKVTKNISDLEISKSRETKKLGDIRERIATDGISTINSSSGGGILSPIINLLSEIRDILSKISGVPSKNSEGGKSGSSVTPSGKLTSETKSMLSKYWQKKNGKSATKEEWEQLKKDYIAGKLSDLDEVLAQEVQKKAAEEKKKTKRSTPKSKDKSDKAIDDAVSAVATEVAEQGAEEGKKAASSKSKKQKYAGGLTWQQTLEKIKKDANTPKDGLSLEEYITQAQSLYNQINSWVGEHNIEYFSKRLELGSIMQKAAVAAKKENPDKGFKNTEWYKYFAAQYNMENVNSLALTATKLKGNKEIMSALADTKPVDTTQVTEATQNIADQVVKTGAKNAEKTVNGDLSSSTIIPDTTPIQQAVETVNNAVVESITSTSKDISKMSKEEQTERLAALEKLAEDRLRAAEALKNGNVSKSKSVFGEDSKSPAQNIVSDEIKTLTQLRQLVLSLTEAIDRGQDVLNKNVEYGFTEKNGKKVEFAVGNRDSVYYNNDSAIDSMTHSHVYKKGVNNLMFSLGDIEQLSDLASNRGLKQYNMMYGREMMSVRLGKDTEGTALEIANKYPIINDVITAMFSTVDGENVAAQNSGEMARILNGYLQKVVEQAGGKLSIADIASGTDTSSKYSITDDEYSKLSSVVAKIEPYYEKILSGTIQASQQEYVNVIRNALSQAFGGDFISSLINRRYENIGGIGAEYSAFGQEIDPTIRALLDLYKNLPSESKKLNSRQQMYYDEYKNLSAEEIAADIAKLRSALGIVVEAADDSAKQVKPTLTKAQIAALDPDNVSASQKSSIKQFAKTRNWNESNVGNIEKVLGTDNKTLVAYKTQFEELAKIALDLKTKGEAGTIITKDDISQLDVAIAKTKELQSELTKQTQFKQLKDSGLIVSGKTKIKSTDSYSERQGIMEQYAKKYASQNKSEYQFGQYDFINDKISFDMIDGAGQVTKIIMGWSDAFNTAYIQSSKLQGSLDKITQEVYKTDEAIKAGEEYGFFQEQSEGVKVYKDALAEYEAQVKAVAKSSQKDLAQNFEALHTAQEKVINAGKDLLDKQKDAYGFNNAQKVLGRTGDVDAVLQNYRDQGINVSDIELVRNYNDAIEALKQKREALKESGKLWDSDEQPGLKLLADRAIEAEKALLNADKAQRQLNGSTIQGDKAKFFEGVDVNNVEQVKQAMTQYALSIKGVDAQSIKWNEDQNTLSYSVRTGKREVSDFTVGMRDLTSEFYNARTGARAVKTGMEQFLGSVGDKFKEVGRYLLSFGSFYRIWGEIQKGVTYVKEIDAALTELKKVTDETDATYAQFLKTMSQTGAEVGATVTDLTNMAANWARLGYSIEEAGELAKSTAVLLNVSEFTDADTASEALISTMQAYGYAAEDSMRVVDVLNEILTCLSV